MVTYTEVDKVPELVNLVCRTFITFRVKICALYNVNQESLISKDEMSQFVILFAEKSQPLWNPDIMVI